ncbi:hypothetical protein ACLK19_06510 [Escherichia coli]
MRRKVSGDYIKLNVARHQQGQPLLSAGPCGLTLSARCCSMRRLIRRWRQNPDAAFCQ